MTRQTSVASLLLCVAVNLHAHIPAGIKNKNPGNIYGRQLTAWPGAYSSDRCGYLHFRDYRDGIRGIKKILNIYKAKYGVDTLAQISKKWTGNSNQMQDETRALVAWTHFKKNEIIDLNSPCASAKVAEGIIFAENSEQPYSIEVINTIFGCSEINSAFVCAISHKGETIMLNPITITATTAVAAGATSNWIVAVLASIGSFFGGLFTGKSARATDAVLQTVRTLSPAVSAVMIATGNPAAGAAVTGSADLLNDVISSHKGVLDAIAAGATPAIVNALQSKHLGALASYTASVKAVSAALLAAMPGGA